MKVIFLLNTLFFFLQALIRQFLYFLRHKKTFILSRKGSDDNNSLRILHLAFSRSFFLLFLCPFLPFLQQPSIYHRLPPAFVHSRSCSESLPHFSWSYFSLTSASYFNFVWKKAAINSLPRRYFLLRVRKTFLSFSIKWINFSHDNTLVNKTLPSVVFSFPFFSLPLSLSLSLTFVKYK